MTRSHHTISPTTRAARLFAGVVALAAAGTATAQIPENAPPWWGLQDEVTVSLSWNFDTPFQPGQLPTLQPSFQVVPSWYANPQPFTVVGDPLEYVAALQGHQGVLGLRGATPPQNLQAELNLFVDNDPHLDWVKIFWFQFDAFKGNSGDIEHEIQQQLSKYGRAAVTVKTAPLSGGWEQVTVSAELIPQPDDEDIDFTFLQSASGITAIDNLHVSSKCVKPRPDEDGDALGKVRNSRNLTLATGGRNCRAVAVTHTPVGTRRFWVTALGQAAGARHDVFEVDQNGVPIGTPTLLPSTTVQAPLGPMDMTVERRRLATGGVQEIVYVLLRNVAGDLRIRAFDPTGTGQLAPALDTLIPSSAAPIAAGQRLGLAFDPTGDGGAGTFWVTGRDNATLAPRAFEFDRQGQNVDAFDVPPDTFGFDYDETLGNFYCFSRSPIARPGGGSVQVVGVEISGFTQQPTGVRFVGDLNVPNPGGTPGGLASGMTVLRESIGNNQSELRFVCVAETAAGQVYYELSGPFRYGYSRFGTIGMDNGPPFVGGSFDVTLTGVPTSVLAMLFLGSDSNNVPLGPGIQSESVASIVPVVGSPLLAPSAPGEFRFTITIPSTVPSYAETFYQWVVFDTSVVGALGFSQAGKTVIYP